MLLAEELILLLLDDDSGEWLVRRRAVHRAVRVAVVVELLARRRVSLDDDGTFIVGLAGTTGGDPVLEQVASAIEGRKPVDIGTTRRAETRALLRRLRDRGVLRRGLVRRSRHLPREAAAEAQVRERLRAALLGRLRPDRHTALLVALVLELDLLPRLLPDQEQEQLEARATDIATQLRADQHYFPATSSQDDHPRVGPGDVLDGIGVAMDALELLSVVVRLASLPVRAALRVLEALP